MAISRYKTKLNKLQLGADKRGLRKAIKKIDKENTFSGFEQVQNNPIKYTLLYLDILPKSTPTTPIVTPFPQNLSFCSSHTNKH